MMVVHMLSPDDSYDQLYISNYARIRVRDMLLRLDGVGDIISSASANTRCASGSIPNKLAAYRHDRRRRRSRRCRSRTSRSRAARSASQPAPTNPPSSSPCTTQGRFEDARQFRQVIVKSTDGRAARARLQDVARVELGASDYVTNSYLNGKPAVALGHLPAPRHQRARRRGRDHQDR